MSLSTYYLEYGRHLARLRRRRRRRRRCRRRRRRAYAPTSNTASHDNHEKIHRWVSLDFHIRDAYGAPLGGPSGRRSSAITGNTRSVATYLTPQNSNCTIEVIACILDLLSQLTVFRSLTSLFFFIRVCYVQRTPDVIQLLVRDRKFVFQMLEGNKIENLFLRCKLK